MTRLCPQDLIEENTAKGFTVGEHNLFAVKSDGEIFVFHNSCPHLGVELNWQEDQFLDLDGELIQCATHGALFVVQSGECIAGPCRGAHLQAVAFNLTDGWIDVQL
jgi:nitrite reductase/ring-hydroxylating ferredoxin subunit